MINILDKAQCSGCSACEQVCPVECIKMIFDEEGFSYPYVDKNNCISCGLCLKSCRYLKDSFKKTTSAHEFDCYAYVHSDKEILYESSSGGAFSAISEYVLQKEGYVVGALYNENMEVTHEITNKNTVCNKFRKSKYVQSNINSTYKKAKKLLREDNLVLFVGTPCQIAGLYAYLGSDYENLLTVDLLCKGVVSPLIFKDYLDIKQKKYKSKIVDYKFRDKENGWGKNNEKYLKILTEDGKMRKIKKNIDIYYGIFSRAVGLRPSCLNCIFTKKERESDITIGDFHDINKFSTNIISNVGVSIILGNSHKGKYLAKQLDNCNMVEIYDYKKQRGVFNNPTKGYTKRDAFFREYHMYGLKIAAFNHVTIKRIVGKLLSYLKINANRIEE